MGKAIQSLLKDESEMYRQMAKEMGKRCKRNYFWQFRERRPLVLHLEERETIIHKVRNLLIEPPLTGSIKGGIGTAVEPLGLAYLAAVLEQNGYSVEILDAYALGCDLKEKIQDDIYRVGLPQSAIREKLMQYKPDIVGISCKFSTHYRDSLIVAKLAKETCPNACVVLGGAHATILPESVLEDRNVDIVVIGEGEQTFLELVQRVEQGRDMDDLKGIAHKRGSQFVRNPPRTLIENLDQIPFPARHLLSDSHKPYPTLYQGQLPFAMNKPVANIVTTRGCMLNCVFCGVHTIWGHSWRPRSPKNVVDEIEQLVHDYGIREFNVMDDNFAWKKSRAIETCNEILRRGLNITWVTPGGVAIYSINKETLATMKKSGYYRVTFAVETGSEKTMKFIGKPINLDHAKKMIAVCHELGLWVHSSFVIGFPGEELESIEATIAFAKECGIDTAIFYVAQPYPGTRLFHIFQEQGLLKKGIQDASSTTVTKYDTDLFTAEELTALQRRANKEFLRHRILTYLHPITFRKQVWPKINSPKKFIYLLRAIYWVLRNQLTLKRLI